MSISNLEEPNNFNLYANSITYIERPTIPGPGIGTELWADDGTHPLSPFARPRWGTRVISTTPAPIPSPIAAETVYVRIWGSDVTGDGSLAEPYATVGHAMTTITTSSLATPFIIDVGPGVYTEVNILFQPDVFVVGQNYNSVILNVSGNVALGGVWGAATFDISGFSGCQIVGPVNIDFSAVASANGAFWSYDSYFLSGPIIFTGEPGSLNNFPYFANCFIGTAVDLHNCFLESDATNYTSITVTNTAVGQSLVLIGGAALSLLSINTTVAYLADLISSPCLAITTLGAGVTTLNVTCDSLPPKSGQTLVGGTLITYLNDATGEGFTPLVSGNWSPVPTSVQGALDQLGVNAKLVGYTNNDNTGLGVGVGVYTGALQETLVGYQAGGGGLITGIDNTMVGYQSGFAITTGQKNVGVGDSVLTSCTTGSFNTGVGHFALNALTTGQQNCCIGDNCGKVISSGQFDNGVGVNSLALMTTGSDNNGFGTGTLQQVTTGADNSAFGHSAGNQLLTGSRNCLLGMNAGTLLNGAESDDICISNNGTAGVSARINLGTFATHTSCFLAGCAGVAITGGNQDKMIMDRTTGQSGSFNEHIFAADRITTVFNVPAGGATTTIIFNNLVVSDAGFNTGTGVFTVPVGGTGVWEYTSTVTYQFTETGAIATVFDAEIFFLPSAGTSTGTSARTTSTGTGIVGLQISLTTKMIISQTAGDTISVQGICGNANPTGGLNALPLESMFSGRRIR